MHFYSPGGRRWADSVVRGQDQNQGLLRSASASAAAKRSYAKRHVMVQIPALAQTLDRTRDLSAPFSDDRITIPVQGQRDGARLHLGDLEQVSRQAGERSSLS